MKDFKNQLFGPSARVGGTLWGRRSRCLSSRTSASPSASPSAERERDVRCSHRQHEIRESTFNSVSEIRSRISVLRGRLSHFALKHEPWQIHKLQVFPHSMLGQMQLKGRPKIAQSCNVKNEVGLTLKRGKTMVPFLNRFPDSSKASDAIWAFMTLVLGFGFWV